MLVGRCLVEVGRSTSLDDLEGLLLVEECGVQSEVLAGEDGEDFGPGPVRVVLGVEAFFKADPAGFESSAKFETFPQGGRVLSGEGRSADVEVRSIAFVSEIAGLVGVDLHRGHRAPSI